MPTFSATVASGCPFRRRLFNSDLSHLQRQRGKYVDQQRVGRSGLLAGQHLLA